MGDVFDVLLGDGQSSLEDARPQCLFLFFGILTVVQKEHADARLLPFGMSLKDVRQQNHQAGIARVFWVDPQVDVVFVAKLPAAASQQGQVSI